MTDYTRRDFMKKSFATAVGVMGAASLFPGQSVLGANDEIHVGVIGFRNKGAQHIEVFHELPGVKVTALCDVDQKFLDREVAKFTERGEKVEAYRDARNLIESKNVDAVVIATPDHWHALMTIWACQAGKDVYVEKPVSYNIWEGKKVVEAARKYDRVVQAGTQQRSDTGLRPAFQYIQEGNIGEIQWAYAMWYRRRHSIGNVPGPQQIPGTVDYNLWTGPAPLESLERRRLHYDWHWDWTFGTGESGNLAVHNIDDCRWAMQEDGLPKRAMMLGGRFNFHDDGETPNTQLAIFDYNQAPLISEVRNLPHAPGKEYDYMDHYRDIRMGDIIQCENGYFAGGRGGGRIFDNDDNELERFPGDGGGTHQANFIDAVRSRNREILHADIQEGHISTALCHMANLSYRSGRGTGVQKIQDRLQEWDRVQQFLTRVLTHLGRNKVDLEKTPLTMGPWMEVDLENDRVSGGDPIYNRIASSLYQREYRSPFVVPEKV